jgi:plasmid stabilization system protein ParE
MAYEVRLAKRAVNDLRHIYKTIEADTSQAADVWFRGLESAIFSLKHTWREVRSPQSVLTCVIRSMAPSRTSTGFSTTSAKPLK